MTDVKWVKKDPQGKDDPDLVMPEDDLGALEREVVKCWPEIEKEFAMIRPGTHPLKLHKSLTDPVELSLRRSHVDGRLDQMQVYRLDKNQAVEIEDVERSQTLKTI